MTHISGHSTTTLSLAGTSTPCGLLRTPNRNNLTSLQHLMAVWFSEEAEIVESKWLPRQSASWANGAAQPLLFLECPHVLIRRVYTVIFLKRQKN